MFLFSKAPLLFFPEKKQSINSTKTSIEVKRSVPEIKPQEKIYHELLKVCQQDDLKALTNLIEIEQKAAILYTITDLINHPLNKENQTALHLVCINGNLDMANYLLSLGAKLNATDMTGKIPLHYTCMKGYVALTESLLIKIEEKQLGSWISHMDHQGYSPLMLAVIYKQKNLLKKCVERHVLLTKKEMDALAEYLNCLQKDNDPDYLALNSLIQEIGTLYSNELSLLNRDKHHLSCSVNKNADYLIPYHSLKFCEELGSGGYGTVYKGKWQYTDVAIKQLHSTQLNQDIINDFVSEAEVMRQLRHPHIVSIYGISVDQQHSLIMEYLSKGALFTVLHTKQDLSWKLRWDIGKQIAIGISYLHDRNILHRDLKSLNILLDDQMNAKVSDFGFSTLKKNLRNKSIQQHAGSIQWMAPELFDLLEDYSEKSDIFSYGMILYELITREIPYGNKTSFEIQVQVQLGEREAIPQETPQPFAHLIQWCWKQKPQDRPAISDVLKYMENNDHLFHK